MYLGAYLGLTPSAPPAVTAPPVPVPVSLPAQPGAVSVVDHIASAIARIAEQFKAKS